MRSAAMPSYKPSKVSKTNKTKSRNESVRPKDDKKSKYNERLKKADGDERRMRN
jgi:hypothetical protein